MDSNYWQITDPVYGNTPTVTAGATGDGGVSNPNDPNIPILDPFAPPPPPALPAYAGDLPSYQQGLPQVDAYNPQQSANWMDMGTGGVSPTDPRAQAFDYNSVNDFADAAYQNSMRYIEPQQQVQDERFAQELINKGIDPNSDAGQKAFRQKEMTQNDQMSKAAFDAMGFGQGMQAQMFGQDQARSQLANALMQQQMGLSQRGHEFDTQAGMGANQQAFEQMQGLENMNYRDYMQQLQNMQYGDQYALALANLQNQQYQFGTNAGLASNQLNYNQMMGLEGLNYRDYLTGVDQSRYQDSLALALMGLSGGPSYGTVNTGLPNAPVAQYQSDVVDYQNLWR